jgi:hypothetical protein
MLEAPMQTSSRRWPLRSAGRFAAGCVAVAALAMAGSAGAFPSSRLVYARGAGAERCPQETALRQAVAARLGYDPFFAAAERTIVLVIGAKGAELEAKVYLVDASGVVRGLREFSGPAERCGDLVYAAALSISIAIDPAQAAAPPPAAPPPEESVPPVPVVSARREVRAESPPVPVVAPSPGEGVRWVFGAGGAGVFGSTPMPSLRGAIFGSARLGSASFSLEATADVPSTVDEPRYTFSSIGLSAAPCLHGDPFFSCLVGTASRFAATGLDPRAPAGQSGLFLGAGVRGGVEFPLFPKLRLRVHADGIVSLLQVRISSNGREIWRASPVGGALGGALAYHF